MPICDQPVSFDDFKVLASSTWVPLKNQRKFSMSRDQPISNKNEPSLPLYLFD